MHHIQLFEQYEDPDHREYGEIIASEPEFAGYLEKILAHVGAKTAKPLGYGGWGAAYLLNTGRVLKITHDDVEAYCAHVVKQQPRREFARIHTVQGVEFDAGKYNAHFWVTTQEYITQQPWLTRLTKNWFYDQHAPYGDVLSQGTYNRALAVQHCRAKGIDQENMLWLLDGLVAIKKALAATGLQDSSEIHPGNLGYRSLYGDRHLVLFDLGGGRDDFELEEPRDLIKTILL